jgi:hypothetical protein
MTEFGNFIKVDNINNFKYKDSTKIFECPIDKQHFSKSWVKENQNYCYICGEKLKTYKKEVDYEGLDAVRRFVGNSYGCAGLTYSPS